MGLFDKIKDEAEKLMQHKPDAAQTEQAKQAAQDAMHNPGNLGNDMDAAKDMIRQQGGDQDTNMDASAGDTMDRDQGQGQ